VDMAAVMRRVQEKIDRLHEKKDLRGNLERSGAQVLIGGGITVEQLARLEIAYPTYTAILGAAAQQIVRDRGAVSTAQWRALGQLAHSPR